MRTDELRRDDLVVLLALARHLSNLDDVISLPELTAFRELRAGIGPEAFHAATEQARKLATLDLALEAAAEVRSAEARDLIRTTLQSLAASDGVIAPEQSLLDALAAAWA